MPLNDFFTDFCMLDRKSVPDGMGGVIYEYTDGVAFRAGISTENSTQARIAYQTGARVIYTIVTDTHMQLEVNDRVKRLSDGQRFRITSNASDMTTPEIAQMQYSQVTAEAVSL